MPLAFILLQRRGIRRARGRRGGRAGARAGHGTRTRSGAGAGNRGSADTSAVWRRRFDLAPVGRDLDIHWSVVCRSIGGRIEVAFEDLFLISASGILSDGAQSTHPFLSRCALVLAVVALIVFWIEVVEGAVQASANARHRADHSAHLSRLSLVDVEAAVLAPGISVAWADDLALSRELRRLAFLVSLGPAAGATGGAGMASPMLLDRRPSPARDMAAAAFWKAAKAPLRPLRPAPAPVGADVLARLSFWALAMRGRR